MHKKIGIIAREEKQFKKIYKVFNQEIINVINNYNCIPIGIIINFNNDSNNEFIKIKELINICDGIILQGGSDFYEIDKKIVKHLYKKDIPTLGICLGMQTMAVALGGEINKLNYDNHNSNDNYVHLININKESKLYEIIKKKEIVVNSRHVEYIKNTILNVGAISNDYVIEEVEDKNKKFFVGVQWHPETLFFDKNSKLLFDDFFNKIKEA